MRDSLLSQLDRLASAQNYSLYRLLPRRGPAAVGEEGRGCEAPAAPQL
jgi:hypothetical protein